MSEFVTIPDESLILTILTIIGISVLTYMVLYLCAYQERSSKVLTLEQNALKAGVPVDEVELAKVKNFHNVYLISMLLGMVVSSVLTYVSMITIVPNLVVLDCTSAYMVYSLLAGGFVSLAVDRFFCHPIADGQFKTKVVNPLLDEAIARFQTVDSAGVKMTSEQRQKLLDFLTNL